MPYKDQKKNTECSLAWYYKHPERKEKQRKNMLLYRKQIREEIFKLLGGKCVNPFNLNHGDFSNDSRLLHIDHINGNGAEERKIFGAKDKYYRHILEQIKLGSKDYQLLCPYCHKKKTLIERIK